MPLDVLVAGLIPPPDAPPEMRDLRLPALEKWLARSDVARDGARTASAWLARAFRLEAPVPAAAVSLAAGGERPAGTWLRADPVHVRIARERTSLHPASVLDLARDETDAMIATLSAHFAGDGLEFHAAAADAWFVRIPPAETPITTPLEEALGQDVRKLLPTGRGRIAWPGVLTEVQMLLANHEANARREAAGKPAVNSVWFWGAGEMPARVERAYDAVHADDTFARGLAMLAGSRAMPTPLTLAEVRDAKDTHTLVFSDAPQRAIHRGDAGEWREAALRLDRDWFGALGDAVSRFGGVRLVMPSSADSLVARLTGAARFRWLRSRKPLAAYG